METTIQAYGPEDGLPPKAHLFIAHTEGSESRPVALQFHGITMEVNRGYRPPNRLPVRLTGLETTALVLTLMGTPVSRIANFMDITNRTVDRHRLQYSRKLGILSDFPAEHRSPRAAVIANTTGLYRYKRPEAETYLSSEFSQLIQVLGYKYGDRNIYPAHRSEDWLQRKMSSFGEELKIREPAAILMYGYAIGELATSRSFQIVADTSDREEGVIGENLDRPTTFCPGVKYVIH